MDTGLSETAPSSRGKANQLRAGPDRAIRYLASLLMINTGKIDQRSLGYGIGGSVAYFTLAAIGLSLMEVHTTLASVWLPNASMVALLLLARLRNEIPIFIAIGIGSLAAQLLVGNTMGTAAIFTLAHLVDVTLVTWLVRKSRPDMPDDSGLTRLGPVLQFGGVIGPLSLCLIAAFGLGLDWSALSAWLLADSMGMILVVPAALVIEQAWKAKTPPQAPGLLERLFLTSMGLAATFFVFQQNLYPLMFLVPPITLLIAFRVGAVGTALYVPALGLIAAMMTYQGIGPIVQSVPDEMARTHLLQAFIAANFLAGLPIAAILAGRTAMTSELKRSRSELAMLTESITDAVLWIDHERICTYASPAVKQVMGLPAQDMVGHPITVRSHEDAEERIVAVLDRLLEGESEQERLTYRRLLDAEDGSPVFIEADCAVVRDPTGQRSGVVLSARDVTERVELELELTRARSNAENAAHAKTEFLANMSHEIRTPMNGVLGFAELMLQGDLDDESRTQTEMIVHSGRSMMLLLNDILDLSKIESGQVVIDREPVDLFSTITECAALHRASAEQKGLGLQFHSPCTPRLGCESECMQCDYNADRPWIFSDSLRLRQIILNLIGNAVKFTESGSIDITYAATDKEISIAVKDTGIGISKRGLETIFAPFTQAESSTARRFGGTGLGLTISRQLAELLGGVIAVESEPGIGSTFKLTLPAEFVEPKEHIAEDLPSVEPSHLPQAARILLVEDHDVNRMLGIEMLERCGQSVAIAQDGNEAIAMVIDSVMRDRPYDLVLMDIQMPGCDGYAATRAIRADGIGPDQLPIIALTANAFPEDIAAARDAGMQSHLAKPLVFADLARALQRWLPVRIVEHNADEQEEPRSRDVLETSSTEAKIIDSSRPADNTPRIGGQLSKPPHRTEATPLNAPPTPKFPRQEHSPAMLSRWNERRDEAIEAVREALEKGSLTNRGNAQQDHEQLARLVHKLAGTAAIFGEPKLGDQAAAFEHALRSGLSAEVREALAFELLCVADDPSNAETVAES